MSLVSLHGEGQNLPDIAVGGLGMERYVAAGQADFLDVRPVGHVVVEEVAPDCLEFHQDWAASDDQSAASDAYPSDTTL